MTSTCILSGKRTQAGSLAFGREVKYFDTISRNNCAHFHFQGVFSEGVSLQLLYASRIVLIDGSRLINKCDDVRMNLRLAHFMPDDCLGIILARPRITMSGQRVVKKVPQSGRTRTSNSEWTAPANGRKVRSHLCKDTS